MFKRAASATLIAALLLGLPGPESCSALAATIASPASGTAAAPMGAAGAALGAPGTEALAGEIPGSWTVAPLSFPDAGLPPAAPAAAQPALSLPTPALAPTPEAMRPASVLAPARAPEAGSQNPDGSRAFGAVSPLLTPADPEASARAPSATLLADPGRLGIPALESPGSPAGSLRREGQLQMDAILGTLSAKEGEADPAPSADAPRIPAPAGEPHKDGPELVAGGLRRYHHLPGGSEELVDPMFTASPEDEGARVILELPPSSAPAGPLARAWRWLTSPFRVLPDKERNRAFWKFMFGQALLNLGIEFHYTALNGMVTGKEENSPRVTQNRALSWGAQAASTLTTGPLVDRSSVRLVLVWTYFGRALLMMTVPILFMYGYHIFALFQATLVAGAFLQSMSGTASSVAFQRILASDEEHYDKANAIYMLVIEVVGVFAPLLAGAFIGYMDMTLGKELIGNALSYGVYGLALLSMAVFYFFFLHIPRDEMLQVRRDLLKSLTRGPGRNPRVRNVSTELDRERPVLVVRVAGDPEDRSGIPAEFAGFPVEVKAAIGPLREMMTGFRLLWKNRFLRLTTLFSTLEAMSSDALIFAALPIYIRGVLDRGIPVDWLQHLPFGGPFLGGIATMAGLFGLYRAASALGGGIPTLIMSIRRRRPGPEAPPPQGKMDRMERSALFTSILYGIGSLFYAAVFFVPNLWVSVLMIFLSSLLQSPSIVVWGSLHQRVMQKGYPAEGAAMVYSAQSFYGILCEILGLLIFGSLMGFLSSSALLHVAAGALVLIAAIHTVEPFLVLPLDRSPNAEPEKTSASR